MHLNSELARRSTLHIDIVCETLRQLLSGWDGALFVVGNHSQA